ncbi:putative permease, YjgP/YjgQ family [Treponema primitia ZAS-2]|uniref:Putative permease, YjgP/YjgQ family n=1 Tax=Treponema primitia (strain ATCC BAA-887 / DSM 12427 / ZAS-2) TaxID=545694 RepID=F5YM23_TREPZ|nr:LptF/LptG family permease [Treponema primitia]AEF85077.1 putative permease, YjgP/YjgQ family [Treponema primitia ZAS-2]
MILDRYLLRQFFPVFIVAITMFVMLLSLIDLFANLWRYLNYEVPLKEILRVCLYYLPKSCSYALPISLLFASAYTLGDLYARNELTSIFSSGIPFWRFALPLVAVGLLASAFAFFFEDRLVVPTFKVKNDMGRLLLHQQRTENNSDIVIKARNGELIYSVDYYDVNTNTLNGLNIIEQDEKGAFIALIRAPRANWTGEHWALSNALIYRWEDGLLRVRPLEGSDDFREQPDTFRRNAVAVEDLRVRDAGFLVQDLRAAGLPFIGALAEYYHRYSFSAVSLVVMVLSISMGGRFRKNILLMSLLASLVAAVVFYVTEMITMMMARLGYIPPIVGAWFPVLVFIIIGLLLLRGAKT